MRRNAVGGNGRGDRDAYFVRGLAKRAHLHAPPGEAGAAADIARSWMGTMIGRIGTKATASVDGSVTGDRSR